MTLSNVTEPAPDTGAPGVGGGRKLATVDTITALRPIPGADAIEVATVRGWDVVVRKDAYRVGQKIVFFEVDTLLPVDDPRFAFLAPRGIKTVDVEGGSVSGHVLRTVKLRGQVSQGLVMSADELGLRTPGDDVDGLPDGSDLTEALGVFKYEPPIPAHLAGQVAGVFPTRFAPKTDAERAQNLTDAWAELAAHPAGWVATEKVDGSSVTIIADPDDGRIRYCSRNLEQKPTPELSSRVVDERIGLSAVLEPGMVVQAEIAGPGIQGNPLRLSDVRLVVFNVLDARRNYLPRDQWPSVALRYAAPVLELAFPATAADAVAQAAGLTSAITPGARAEGVVWHTRDGRTLTVLDGRACFKAINNVYLLKAKG